MSLFWGGDVESDFESSLSVDSCILYIRMYVCRSGVSSVERVVRPLRAAESKGRQNEYFELKKKIALNKFLDY